MTTENQLLREALRKIKYEAVSLGDAQVIALEALTQPAQAGEADNGPRVLREVFALCEATEDAPEPKPVGDTVPFMRGRKYEAKAIRKAIGAWFQDEFCGRSFMGEPVTTPPASQEQAKPAISEQDATLLVQAHDMLLAHADEQRRKGNDSEASGAECSADAALRLGAQAASQEQAQQPSTLPGCDECHITHDLGACAEVSNKQVFAESLRRVESWDALPFTDDIVQAIRESGMTFHLGMPHTVVVEQLARFADLIKAQATIKAATAFATPKPEPMTWQPIETAPKDGTEFLGWRHGRIATARLVPRDDCEMWCFGGESFDFESFPALRPTHWMPPPEAPGITSTSTKEQQR